jgi:hypothetical protein
VDLKGIGKGRHKNHARGPTNGRWNGGRDSWLRWQPEYRSWAMMMNRCRNPNADDWSYYGGRGITVCQAWLEYVNFLRDMGRRPTPKHTLERRNNNGNYNKRNCYWATRQQQARNRPAYLKLSLLIARKIRKEYARGVVRQVDLSARYKTNQATISQIIRGVAWRES